MSDKYRTLYLMAESMGMTHVLRDDKELHMAAERAASKAQSDAVDQMFHKAKSERTGRTAPSPGAYVDDQDAADAKFAKGEQWGGATKARQTAMELFLFDVERELSKAREKSPDAQASLAAATEELGELAKALLSESPERIYHEAVQLATMAARIATDGDRSLNDYRVHHGVDGAAKGLRS